MRREIEQDRWEDVLWKAFSHEIDSGCAVYRVERECNIVHPILYDWYTGRRNGVGVRVLQKLAKRYGYILVKEK